MDCEINVDTQPQMSPCTTARRGGRAIKKISRSSADREAGVVFRWMQKENHPGCVRFGRCATFFLMTQPPLLAVMQGGEWRCLKHSAIFFTASPSAPLRSFATFLRNPKTKLVISIIYGRSFWGSFHETRPPEA